MAYKLIWSPAARDDLHDIVVFIARDNPNRAMSFAYELMSRQIGCKTFQGSVASFLNIEATTFARSSFDRIDLCTELIKSESSAKSPAFGIQREGFLSYNRTIKFRQFRVEVGCRRSPKFAAILIDCGSTDFD